MKRYINIVITIVAITALISIGIAIYNRGYSDAEDIYQQKSVKAAISKIENTETLEKHKEKLKQREKNLNEDCKNIYSTNLSACRIQLHGKR